MIFTLRSNQARVEREVSKAVKEALEEADNRAREAVRERQQAWEAWNERRLAAEREGQPFSEPPPGSADKGNGQG